MSASQAACSVVASVVWLTSISAQAQRGAANPVTIGGTHGDLNLSGQTDHDDFNIVVMHWGKDAAERPSEWINDLPQGRIDHFDLNQVLLNWGQTHDNSLETLPSPTFSQIQVRRTDPSAVLPGFVTNDVLLTFSGFYTGSQLRVELARGSVFQGGLLGSSVPPLEAVVQVFPELEFDTFVANGGLTSSTTWPLELLGGAVNLGTNPAATFDTSGINQTWIPARGTVLVSHSDFVVARVTLSEDARGWFSYVAFDNGVPLRLKGRVLNGTFTYVPEPSTAVLLAAVLAPFAMRRALRR